MSQNLPTTIRESIKEVFRESYLLRTEVTGGSYEDDIEFFESFQANYEKRAAIAKRARKLEIPYTLFLAESQQLGEEVLSEFEEKVSIEEDEPYDIDEDQRPDGRI